MPTTASSERTMIWVTAKLTEVSSRHTAQPSRASGSGLLEAIPGARVAARFAIGSALDGRRRAPRSGCRRRGARGCKPRLEVRDEVVEILESHGAAQEAGGDAARREGGFVELTVGRRRRVDDHREHASQRGG